MNSHHEKSLGPQFLLLIALFVLSLLAPSAWQSSRKKASLPLRPTNPATKFKAVPSQSSLSPRVSNTHRSTISESPLIQTTSIEPLAVIAQKVNPQVTSSPTTRLQEYQPRELPPTARRQIMEPIPTIRFATATSVIPIVHGKEVSMDQVAVVANNSRHAFARPKPRYPHVMQMISHRVPGDTSSWPRPITLLEQLKGISVYQPAKSWGQEVQKQLEQLLSYRTFKDPGTEQTLAHLTNLVKTGNTKAEAMLDLDFQSSWLRTIYALDRRLTVWKAIHQIAAGTSVPPQHLTTDTVALVNQLVAVRKELESLSSGESWISYLLIRELTAASRETNPADSQKLNLLACHALNRMNSPDLSAAQRDFISNQLFQRLQQTLQQIMTTHLDPVQLLDELEQYETKTTSQRASSLASQYQFLRWSLDDSKRNLATQLDSHYRNANIRIALSQQMINRMLPRPKPMEEPIDDTILGARVSGKSLTSTMLKVLLIPDHSQWRMGVQASGEVSSNTKTRRRVATFHNKGSSSYTVNKDLLVDRRGVRVGRAIGKADIQSELLNFETNFDSLPLVGAMLRSVVRHQYNSQAPHAKDIYESRVSRRVRSRFDEEIRNHLLTVEDRFQSRYLSPLQHLNLAPVAVNLQTTTGSRLILRYRLAGNQQMAAHTPRPRAPGNSLLSLQIHESAVNNTMQNLKLDGKRTDLRSLYQQLAEAFERPDIKIPDEIPTNVTVSMADHEAIRVRFEDGKVNLRIHLKELKSGPRHKWKNFILTASYRPAMDQLTASLYRDGHLQFEGKNLRLADRIALQGIFNKALPRTRPINIISKNMAEHPGMQDLTVTQFVVRDTWIGVAIGPVKVAEPRVAKRRKERS